MMLILQTWLGEDEYDNLCDSFRRPYTETGTKLSSSKPTHKRNNGCSTAQLKVHDKQLLGGIHWIHECFVITFRETANPSC